MSLFPDSPPAPALDPAAAWAAAEDAWAALQRAQEAYLGALRAWEAAKLEEYRRRWHEDAALPLIPFRDLRLVFVRKTKTLVIARHRGEWEGEEFRFLSDGRLYGVRDRMVYADVRGILDGTANPIGPAPFQRREAWVPKRPSETREKMK